MGHGDYLKPLVDYLGVSNQESDRGKVLVALAQIDTMLEAILRSFLIRGDATEKLFDGPNAPLASLFNKLNVARALGLVSEDESACINTLRKIRNEFAHSVHARVDDPKISALIIKLKFGLSALIERSDQVLLDERARLSMSATSLITSLYNRSHYVDKQRRSDTTWPA